MSDSPKKKLNLNSATKTELAELPDSDYLLARRILSRRWHDGAFRDFVDLLKRVPGVDDHLAQVWAEVAVIEPPELPLPVVVWDTRWERRAEKAGPIVFAGNTTTLEATVHLENRGRATGFDPVLRIKGGDLKDAAGAPLDRIAVSLKLDPGEAQQAVASVTLDPATPPGRHEANLVLGDRAYPAIFQVPVVTSIEITPSSFLFRESPGANITREIRIRNTGNVEVNIAGFAAVLEEENLFTRAFLNSLERKELDKPEVKQEDVITALVHELRQAVERQPIVTGRFEIDKRK